MQIHLKMGQAISLSWMACFWPLVAGTVFTTIPSVLLLARNEQATVVPVLYHRIVARKTIYDAVLRLFFLALVMAKVGGTAGHLEMRLITLPVWAQLLVLLVILHTSVKSLNDPACARDFKKRSVLIELHLLASLFIAMKIDGNITWTWVGVFWPLVSSRHSRSTRSESACLRACSFCAFHFWCACTRVVCLLLVSTLCRKPARMDECMDECMDERMRAPARTSCMFASPL